MIIDYPYISDKVSIVFPKYGSKNMFFFSSWEIPTGSPKMRRGGGMGWDGSLGISEMDEIWVPYLVYL